MDENKTTGDVKIPSGADVEESFEFESVSCFIISKDSKPRRWIIQLLKWPYPLWKFSVNTKAYICVRFCNYILQLNVFLTDGAQEN